MPKTATISQHIECIKFALKWIYKSFVPWFPRTTQNTNEEEEEKNGALFGASWLFAGNEFPINFTCEQKPIQAQYDQKIHFACIH